MHRCHLPFRHLPSSVCYLFVRGRAILLTTLLMMCHILVLQKDKLGKFDSCFRREAQELEKVQVTKAASFRICLYFNGKQEPFFMLLSGLLLS